jgi:glycerol-3-phosphate cytidylyltransferase
MDKIIGYTTGVFDLFHIGHLNLLKQAKEHCDYLIVGVSTDELVKSYKNKVPVIPFVERMAVVDSIKYVDKVVMQDNRNKIAAWEKYRFNIMFHGDDRKNDKFFIVAENELKKYNVSVMYFPYTKSTSSTLITTYLTTNLAEITR